MGTNYYLYERPRCETCGGASKPLHIGKSSYGWVFSLRIDPADGIKTLDDWRLAWSQPGAYIEDEYGDKVSIDKLESIITDRTHPVSLRRHTIDGRHCVGHGDGTWDLCIGEFS